METIYGGRELQNTAFLHVFQHLYLLRFFQDYHDQKVENDERRKIKAPAVGCRLGFATRLGQDYPSIYIMCLGTRVPLKVVELSNTSFQAQSQCGVLQLMAQLGRPRPTSSHTSKSIVYRFVTIESPCRPGCEPTRVDCAVGKSQDISRLSREYASGAELAQGM